jgi:transcriptional regulator with XRE-family HTH domain
MKMGDRIRAAREKLGWSQADLARRVGISQPAIKKIEAGDTVKSKYLAEVLRAVGIAPSEALTVAPPVASAINTEGLNDEQARVVRLVFESVLEWIFGEPALLEQMTDPAYRSVIARLAARYARSRSIHEAVRLSDPEALTAIRLSLLLQHEQEPS